MSTQVVKCSELACDLKGMIDTHDPDSLQYSSPQTHPNGLPLFQVYVLRNSAVVTTHFSPEGHVTAQVNGFSLTDLDDSNDTFFFSCTPGCNMENFRDNTDSLNEIVQCQTCHRGFHAGCVGLDFNETQSPSMKHVKIFCSENCRDQHKKFIQDIFSRATSLYALFPPPTHSRSRADPEKPINLCNTCDSGYGGDDDAEFNPLTTIPCALCKCTFHISCVYGDPAKKSDFHQAKPKVFDSGFEKIQSGRRKGCRKRVDDSLGLTVPICSNPECVAVLSSRIDEMCSEESGSSCICKVETFAGDRVFSQLAKCTCCGKKSHPACNYVFGKIRGQIMDQKADYFCLRPECYAHRQTTYGYYEYDRALAGDNFSFLESLRRRKSLHIQSSVLKVIGDPLQAFDNVNPFVTIRGKKIVAPADVVNVDTYQSPHIPGLHVTPRSSHQRQRQYHAGTKRPAPTPQPTAQKCPRSSVYQHTPHQDSSSDSSSSSVESPESSLSEDISLDNPAVVEPVPTNVQDGSESEEDVPLAPNPLPEPSPVSQAEEAPVAQVEEAPVADSIVPEEEEVNPATPREASTPDQSELFYDEIVAAGSLSVLDCPLTEMSGEPCGAPFNYTPGTPQTPLFDFDEM